MRGQCFICGVVRKLDSYFICQQCHPSSCISCYASDVQYADPEEPYSRTYKCSHGCNFTLTEYFQRRFQTIMYNGSWRDRLSIAGERIEYIISDPEAVTVHNSVPNEKQDDTILGTHFTESPEDLIENGIDPTELEEPTERLEGTIRDGAAYAWPYTVTFAKQALDWPITPVVFEIPRESVRVSSYKLLRNCSDRLEYGIPPDKYEEVATFTPEQLRKVCVTRHQPAEPETLFISKS